ncbi:hypothetical protein [Phaeocystidibacter luteus]|uniref:Uncharacterized protein n=1 Tax=Phaeocystidibacter luteus TaxID=911197 RepID=A0A6N6RGU0_9FLAO|nr:hypothetical protein [Phaeocystidibacter luteus]KAB2810399.1 hypothetical protein F8C67_07365 [Phaeocystidibacter luteus]
MRIKSLSAILVAGSLSSCNNQVSSSPPLPVTCCASLANHGYNCQTGSPGNLVAFGDGGLQLVVTSNNAIQFSQITEFDASNFQSPTVQTTNGTGSTGNHKIVSRNVYFDVPSTDSYTITGRYMEYGYVEPQDDFNNASCNNPQLQNGDYGCFRWYKFLEVDEGFAPNCSEFSISINEQDPNSFIAPCEW